MVHPIFIPSKNRSKTSQLLPLLKTSNLNFYFVIEPQEVELYKYVLSNENIISLPQDNQGLVYSRNFILNLARQKNLGWFWMLDDDISRFYKTIDKKNHAASIGEALSFAQKFCRNEAIGQIGLEYSQFAWSAKNIYALNSYCDVCTCINVNVTKGLNYRSSALLKEDRDFTLQILSRGYQTLRVQRYSMTCPSNGSNIGGLHDVYRQKDRELGACKNMVDLWGSEICQIQKKKSGRVDLKINWRYFKQRLVR